VQVAHDALFRAWERLAGWLAKSQEFLLWKQRLRADVAEWKRTNRDHGALLRGMRLQEAMRWIAEHPDDVNEDEEEFIRTSSERAPKLPAMLEPMELVDLIVRNPGKCICRYRLLWEGGTSEWKEVQPVVEPGGVFVYLRDVGPAQLLQIQVRIFDQIWISDFRAQQLIVQLRQKRDL
jgi:hypothetical protein